MKCIPGSQAPCAALAARRQWQSAETWDSWTLGTSFLWRKAAWIELLLSWGIMAGYLSVNRCFQLTYFVCVEKLKISRRFDFFSAKEICIGRGLMSYSSSVAAWRICRWNQKPGIYSVSLWGCSCRWAALCLHLKRLPRRVSRES